MDNLLMINKNSTVMEIPLISIKDIGLQVKSPAKDRFHCIGEDLFSAFASIGFVYITDHGIDPRLIEECMEASKKFFQLPYEEKMKQQMDSIILHGYIEPGREIFTDTGEKNSHEVRESFDVRRIQGEHATFPDDTVPELRLCLSTLAVQSRELAFRIMTALALSLNLDPDYFVRRHSKVFSNQCKTNLRSLYYPPIEDVQPGTTRCGAHTDYGLITLLYQDALGGLKVKKGMLGNGWISAHPIQGAVLINSGDMLEMFTGGKLPATLHKVVIPKEEIKRKTFRQSIAFFAHPDNETWIEPLPGYENIGGVEKYQPTTALEHDERRFAANNKY